MGIDYIWDFIGMYFYIPYYPPVGLVAMWHLSTCILHGNLCNPQELPNCNITVIVIARIVLVISSTNSDTNNDNNRIHNNRRNSKNSCQP